MAHRKMKLTEKGASRGFYRTRMMQAGTTLTMDGPTSKFNERMGWAVEATKAKKAAPKAEPKAEVTETVIPTVEEVLAAEVVEPAEAAPEAEKPAAPKKALAKRTRKKAAAKRNAG